MKKSVTLLFACMLVSACCAGMTLNAHAGIHTNSPTGEGLLSNGELNNTNFVVVDDDDEDAELSDFAAVSGNDLSLVYGGGDEWQEMRVATPVPKATMAKDNVVVDLIYQFTAAPESANGAELLFTPGTSYADQFTYGYVLTAADNGIAVRPECRTAAQPDDPTSKLIAHHGGNAEFPVPYQWQAYSWNVGNGATSMATHITNFGVACFRIRMTVNEQGWIDVKLSQGPIQWGNYVWVGNEGATITNWAPYNAENDLYPNVWVRSAEGLTLENAKLEVSYTEDGDTKTETLFETDMDDKSVVLTAKDAQPSPDHFVACGVTHISLAKAELIVTDPAENAKIVSRNPLAVVGSFEPTFKVNVGYRLIKMNASRKIGIALGLDGWDTPLKTPDGGASFIYLTVNGEGKVVLGADNIAEDGTVTATGTTHVLESAQVGDSAELLTLEMVGKKDGSVDVHVGEDVYNFPAIKASGNIAFAHMGEGSVSYALDPEAFSVTGYEILENEGGKVTSNFDEDYISTNKFVFQSIVSPESYYETQDTTSHEVVGMVAENGKIGFYGTATNTLLMFKDAKYSDYVMQFDYISTPFQNRIITNVSGKGNPTSRYGSLFIYFGADINDPSINDAYALGINEGNPGQGFWGAESLIDPQSRLYNEGNRLNPLSSMKVVDEGTPNAIHCYGSDGDFWGVPDLENDYTYSFYNRVTRVKFVVINDHIALYAAQVDTETNEIIGNYVQCYSATVKNATGYVGFGCNEPTWAEIDNLAITPIAKDVALAQGVDATPTVDLVPDVKVSEMDTDVEPTPLAAPVLKVDATAKKVTWDAVSGAKEYKVTVKLGDETKAEATVETTEYSLAALTEKGDYKITVIAFPEDETKNLESNPATAPYTVSEGGSQPVDPGKDDPKPGPGEDDPEPGPGGEEPEKPKEGCGGVVGSVGIAMLLTVAAGSAIVLLARKRKE